MNIKELTTDYTELHRGEINGGFLKNLLIIRNYIVITYL